MPGCHHNSLLPTPYSRLGHDAAPVRLERRPFVSARPLFGVECLVFEYTNAKRHRLTSKASFYSHQHAVSLPARCLSDRLPRESCKGRGEGRSDNSTRPVSASASARPATRQCSPVRAPPVWFRRRCELRGHGMAQVSPSRWHGSGALGLDKRRVQVPTACLSASRSATMLSAPRRNNARGPG